MSSAVYIRSQKPISLEEWNLFCLEHNIKYNPRTVGGNVYYFGSAEIHFGKSAGDNPPASAKTIIVSTFYYGDLNNVANIAKPIIQKWKLDYSCDPELESVF